jgi:RsmE family RNA methyltransferase
MYSGYLEKYTIITVSPIIAHSTKLVKFAMNLILFERHELQDGRVRMTGRRAEHIRKILRLRVGDTLRVGMVNGKMGQGRIAGLDENEVEIEIQLHVEAPATPNVELILALPRPIMLQRILKQATTLGVRHFHLIRSAKVEKSFFHSPVLKPEKIRSLLLEGLEQAVDTCLPEITVYHRFKPFVEDVAPKIEGKRLIAHPAVTTTLIQAVKEEPELPRIVLAVGPEGGWNEFELECFLEKGFTGFSMGSRILHVDTAVVALLAQLQVLQGMNHG